MKEKGLIGSGKGANWLEGWGASELYWRGKPTLPAFLKYPELAAIKHSLYESGAVYASMSGSGSAMFAIYES